MLNYTKKGPQTNDVDLEQFGSRCAPLFLLRRCSEPKAVFLPQEKSARAFVDNPGGGSAAAFDSGWYVQQAGENRGPLSRTDLCRLHSYNELDSESLVWHPSLEDWNPLRNVRETLGIESIS
ncbi:MAG: DUF4339 domain-containing protein [Verrucomicrobiota bacterium]